ncbi:MAG: DDE-type integrase/transposase/recombinase [Gemmatimonadales bacterium]
MTTGEGWRFLAVVIDLHSRRVVGWATSARCDRVLVLDALDRALVRRGRPALHHSDRGCQPGFNRSLQHGVVASIVVGRSVLRQGSAN